MSTEVWGQPQPWVLGRDGDLDVEFTGWQLGVGTYDNGEVAVTVSIYATTTNKLIVQVNRLIDYEDEDELEQHAVVHILDGASWEERMQKALPKLAANKTALPTASKQAWSAACKRLGISERERI